MIRDFIRAYAAFRQEWRRLRRLRSYRNRIQTPF